MAFPHLFVPFQLILKTFCKEPFPLLPQFVLTFSYDGNPGSYLLYIVGNYYFKLFQ